MHTLSLSAVLIAIAMPAGDGKHRDEHWCPNCDLTAGEIAADVAQLTNSAPPPRHAATTTTGA